MEAEEPVAEPPDEPPVAAAVVPAPEPEPVCAPVEAPPVAAPVVAAPVEAPVAAAEVEAGEDPPPEPPAAHEQTALADWATAGADWTPQALTTQVSASVEIWADCLLEHWQAKSVKAQSALPAADSRQD